MKLIGISDRSQFTLRIKCSHSFRSISVHFEWKCSHSDRFWLRLILDWSNSLVWMAPFKFAKNYVCFWLRLRYFSLKEVSYKKCSFLYIKGEKSVSIETDCLVNGRLGMFKDYPRGIDEYNSKSKKNCKDIDDHEKLIEDFGSKLPFVLNGGHFLIFRDLRGH